MEKWVWERGAIDKSLEGKGLLHFIHCANDIRKIRIEKKQEPRELHFTNLKFFFIDYLPNFQ